jgi:hypothetical protein
MGAIPHGPCVDAVDAQGYLNALAGIFAFGSLVAVLFFIRRANAISVALVGWWTCFVVATFVAAPGTISGSEDVAGWATEAAWAGSVGLVAGGWVGSRIGAPHASPRFLLGCAALSAITGAVLAMAFWLLSDASCSGWLSAEHVRHGYEVDTTFCAANGVLERWVIVYVASIVSLFLLTARSAHTKAAERARVEHASFTGSSSGRC